MFSESFPMIVQQYTRSFAQWLSPLSLSRLLSSFYLSVVYNLSNSLPTSIDHAKHVYHIITICVKEPWCDLLFLSLTPLRGVWVSWTRKTVKWSDCTRCKWSRWLEKVLAVKYALEHGNKNYFQSSSLHWMMTICYHCHLKQRNHCALSRTARRKSIQCVRTITAFGKTVSTNPGSKPSDYPFNVLVNVFFLIPGRSAQRDQSPRR